MLSNSTALISNYKKCALIQNFTTNLNNINNIILQQFKNMLKPSRCATF